MPERLQRIRPGRAPGWDEGRHDHAAQHDGQSAREGDGICRTDAEQDAAQQPADGERDDDAPIAASAMPAAPKMNSIVAMNS